jgi:hypothetical protein
VYPPHQFVNDRIHFGLVDPASEVTRETALLLSARDPIADAACNLTFRPTSAAVTVTPGAAHHEVLPDGTHQARIPIKVVLRAPSDPGAGGASLRIARAGSSTEWNQEVTWNVRSLITVEPRQAFFGSVARGSGVSTRRVSIRRLDGNGLRIVSVRMPGKLVSATILEQKAPDAAEIQFSLDGQQVKSSFWEEAVIEVDHPVQRVVKIPVAWVTPQKDDPSSFDHHKETGK